MTAEEAIAIITGAQVLVTNRDPDKFVAAIDRALIALRLERKKDNHHDKKKGDIDSDCCNHCGGTVFDMAHCPHCGKKVEKSEYDEEEEG